MQIDRPRLADLAKHAKVSIATASRVINQKPGVAERTRRSVYTSAAELGIEIPGLETSKQPVAILTPELNNPSFPAFAQNIDTLLAANNRPSILCPAGPEGTTEAQHVQMLLQMNISGAIAVSGMPADTLSSVAPYELLINSGVPVVFINSYSSDLAATFYSTSDEEGVKAAIAHLSSLGHQKIGLAIGSIRYLPSQRKREAFHNAGFEAASVSTTDYTVEGGQLAANKLIAAGHTAIICGSDMMALGAIRASNALG
ncbi:MAG: LacI family transcriptional regulator, partial [Propionibacterium sp.]